MSFKPKAEIQFERKVQFAIEARNERMMREVTEQYEGYLRLIQPDPAVEAWFKTHEEFNAIADAAEESEAGKSKTDDEFTKS